MLLGFWTRVECDTALAIVFALDEPAKRDVIHYLFDLFHIVL